MIGILIGAIGAIAAIGGWLTIASFVYCRLSKNMALYTFPFFTQWIDVMSDWNNASRWTKIEIVISAAFATLPFVALCIRFLSVKNLRRFVPLLGAGQPSLEEGVTNNYGRARILTDKECLTQYPGPSGVVIGELRTGKAGTAPLVIDPCATGAGHGMLIAGTRSGKTMSLVSMLSHWPSSAVVLDPAVEIGVMMDDALRDNGKTVHLLNPEIPGCGFNALSWIDPMRPLAVQDVKEVISWVFPEDKDNEKKDGYFEPTGKALCAAILADLLWSDRPEEEKTLRTFRDLVVTPESQMPGFLADIHAGSKCKTARDIAGTLMRVTPKQFSGVYGQATQGTEWLSDPMFAELVSGNKFKGSDIIDGNTIIFCQIPLHALELSPGCGRVVMGSLMREVYNAKGNIKGRVLMPFDEAWVLGKMKVQKSALVAGAKSGLTLVFFYQGIGQVREIWGSATEGVTTLYNNLEWRAVAACKDDATAEEFSAAFGNIAVISHSKGVNTGSQRAAFSLWGSRSSGDTSNESEISRRLVLKQEIRDAPRQEMFVIANGNMRLRMPVYYLRPELRDLVKPSPYYQAAKAS